MAATSTTQNGSLDRIRAHQIACLVVLKHYERGGRWTPSRKDIISFLAEVLDCSSQRVEALLLNTSTPLSLIEQGKWSNTLNSFRKRLRKQNAVPPWLETAFIILEEPLLSTDSLQALSEERVKALELLGGELYASQGRRILFESIFPQYAIPAGAASTSTVTGGSKYEQEAVTPAKSVNSDPSVVEATFRPLLSAIYREYFQSKGIAFNCGDLFYNLIKIQGLDPDVICSDYLLNKMSLEDVDELLRHMFKSVTVSSLLSSFPRRMYRIRM